MLFPRVTLRPGAPPTAVRVLGDRVVEVGALSPARGEDVLEVPGALLPGFVDAHVHLGLWSRTLGRVDLSAARSAAEAASMVPAGTTRAYGFRDAFWLDAPHKQLLEAAHPGVELALVSGDVHTLWLSPAMLARLGLDHPTGVLRDEAGIAVLARLDAETSVQDDDAAVLAATSLLASRGITGVVDLEYADNRTAWLRRGRPDVRVAAGTWLPWFEQSCEKTGEPFAELVHAGPLKLMVDGSLNTRTAWCHDPYPDGSYGLLLIEPGDVRAAMRRAHERGLTVAAHAIGDRAVGVVLDAFEATGARGRVEHAQQVRPQDLARFAALGVVASVQPQHALDDRDVADVHWTGHEALAFPYASLHAAGAGLRLGSDAPVSEPDPLGAVAAAVLRTDDHRLPWHPEQALPLDVALRAACGGRGSVGAGDPADLVLLAEHPVRGADLRHTPVLATFVGGRSTYLRA